MLSEIETENLVEKRKLDVVKGKYSGKLECS
jgi:hypothetical protein